VQEALVICWAAANEVCATRLVPFLPELVDALERHGHHLLPAGQRAQLLDISAATADRLLRPHRQQGHIHGISTTKPGALMKRQIPVRTFQDWDDAQPGCLEMDLVVHCGWSTEDAILQSLVLTDVATSWTECLPLLYRSHDTVLAALDRAAAPALVRDCSGYRQQRRIHTCRGAWLLRLRSPHVHAGAHRQEK